MIDLVPILIDETLDVLAARARLRSRVRYGSAESNVIAYEVRSLWSLERVLHVRLLHLEVTVDIASVVSFPTF